MPKTLRILKTASFQRYLRKPPNYDFYKTKSCEQNTIDLFNLLPSYTFENSTNADRLNYYKQLASVWKQLMAQCRTLKEVTALTPKVHFTYFSVTEIYFHLILQTISRSTNYTHSSSYL